MNELKLKLALGILSGRIDTERLTDEDYLLLGFTDQYQPEPRSHEVKEVAEQIILEALLNKGAILLT